MDNLEQGHVQKLNLNQYGKMPLQTLEKSTIVVKEISRSNDEEQSYLPTYVDDKYCTQLVDSPSIPCTATKEEVEANSRGFPQISLVDSHDSNECRINWIQNKSRSPTESDFDGNNSFVHDVATVLSRNESRTSTIEAEATETLWTKKTACIINKVKSTNPLSLQSKDACNTEENGTTRDDCDNQSMVSSSFGEIESSVAFDENDDQLQDGSKGVQVDHTKIDQSVKARINA